MKIASFDFDGTLASTILKPKTSKEALEAGWNGKDWWGSTCSLKSIYLHENVSAAFRNARNDPNTNVAVITGRRGIIAWRIREILRDEGFLGKRMIPQSNTIAQRHFMDQMPDEEHALHEEYFAGDYSTEPDYPKGRKGKPIDNTLTHKTFIIQNRLMNNTITEVAIWEDRPDHLRGMLLLAKELLTQWNNLQKVAVSQVFPQPNITIPYVVQHIFEKNNEDIVYYVKDGNVI